MPTFDLVVVGSGGGPDETNLSAYLLKPSQNAWEDGIVALEAGSGQGALSHILKRNPELFGGREDSDGHEKILSAPMIYSFVQCFLLTHAHLDHINSLVLSAGSLLGPSKRIYGASQTLKDVELVFSDRLWPNLATWDENDESYKLLYHILHADAKYAKISPDISVRLMPVNHGHNDTLGNYESAAYFIRHDPSSHEFLFFGDVEPDSVASKPQNIAVWQAAAPKIPQRLSAIFIECSWPSGRPDDLLYGHLSPEHLVQELKALATEIVLARKVHKRETRLTSRPRKKQRVNPLSQEALRGALTGLRVFIIHCKEDFSCSPDPPINHVIAGQVRALVSASGLGAEILAADQGSLIESEHMWTV
ncbi:hypothetical protein SERLA73DRAFT_185733, partial [Serpula lacrymans var. lacrymans S7.3]